MKILDRLRANSSNPALHRRLVALLLFTFTIIGAGWVASAAGSSSAVTDHVAYGPAIFGEVAGPVMTPTIGVDETATPTATATSSPTSTPTVVGTPTVTATPKPTNTPKPTATQPTELGAEELVFDWNKLVEQSHHGFPRDFGDEILFNGNWVTPVNYAEGTLQFRAEIRNMPTNKTMNLQFCFWQDGVLKEECAGSKTVSYQGTTVVVTWSDEVDGMWQKDGVPIDWTKPRSRNGVAIKTTTGIPVSDYNNWNWGCGSVPSCIPAPTDWYPMDMRFTVYVVEKGKAFSGWDNYIP